MLYNEFCHASIDFYIIGVIFNRSIFGINPTSQKIHLVEFQLCTRATLPQEFQS
jgi:hypothetical protein